MKGFTLIGASVLCYDCSFSHHDIEEDDWFHHATEMARKHNEETGHMVSVELVFEKTFKRRKNHE